MRLSRREFFTHKRPHTQTLCRNGPEAPTSQSREAGNVGPATRNSHGYSTQRASRVFLLFSFSTSLFPLLFFLFSFSSPLLFFLFSFPLLFFLFSLYFSFSSLFFLLFSPSSLFPLLFFLFSFSSPLFPLFFFLFSFSSSLFPILFFLFLSSTALLHYTLLHHSTSICSPLLLNFNLPCPSLLCSTLLLSVLPYSACAPPNFFGKSHLDTSASMAVHFQTVSAPSRSCSKPSRNRAYCTTSTSACLLEKTPCYVHNFKQSGAVFGCKTPKRDHRNSFCSLPGCNVE